MSPAALTIGERLRAIRQRAGLSQQGFASLLGYSKRAILNWELGAAEPPIAILPTIREVFDVDPEWVVSGTDLTPRSLFKPIDWDWLREIDRDVGHACLSVGLDLTNEQREGLVQALYDEGRETYADSKKRMRAILRALANET